MSDMFGGMSTTGGGGRRKRGQTQAANKNDETASNTSSSHNTNDLHDKQMEEQHRRDGELRARLVKFYTYYNPNKIDGIEKTVEMFRGNETKLFEMLNVKYGPEPTPEMYEKFLAERDAKEAAKNAKSNDGKTHLKRRAQHTTAEPTTATSSSNQPEQGKNHTDPNESFASAPAGWGGDGAATTTEATNGFGFGAPSTEQLGSAGASQENLASSGWGDDATAATNNAGGGFGFGGGGDDASSTGAGGFGFGGGDATTTGDNNNTGGFGFGGGETTTTSDNNGGGFGFGAEDTTSANNGGGFGFGGGADTTTETNNDGGFGFGGGEANATVETENNNGGGFGFGAAEGNEAANNDNNNGFTTTAAKESDSDDDSDADATELMDKRLNKRLGDLVSKRDTLADIITNLALAVSERRKTLQLCLELEAKVDDLTQKEQFDAAEETDNQLREAAKKISQYDEQWLENTSRLNGVVEEIKTSISASSKSFAEERGNLTQIRAEEERKMNSYITDATHKVESSAARIKVDLDKAVRAQSHVEQDLEDLQKRKAEIEAKIAEQTKGLRAEKEKVSADAERLEDEIRDLEKLLATKKRQLADKNGQLDDMNHKLELITRNHQEVMNTVLESMAEEETHLRVCKSRVNEITEQKQQNEEENDTLQEEKRVMQRDLDQHNAKISLLEKQSQTLATDVSIGFSGFFKKVVRAISDIRGGEGKFCLMVPYIVAGSEEEEQQQNSSAAASAADSASSQLQTLKATLSKLEQQLTLKSDENATLLSRLQEIQRAIPAIETAKKQAAAAKQFKEAQAKTAELKTLNEEKDQINEQMNTLSTEMASLKKEIDATTVLKDAEAKKFRSSMRSFMDKYSSILRSAADTIEATDDLSCLCVDEILKVDASSAANNNNILREKSTQLLNALFSELASVCEVPESDLRRPSSTASSPIASRSSPVTQQEAPTPAVVPTTAAVEVEEEKQEQQEETPAEEEQQQETEAEAEVSAGPTKEEIQAKIDQLSSELATAEEAEDYGLCDELQTQIDSLTEDLNKM